MTADLLTNVDCTDGSDDSDVPTGSAATVGNWLVREYFWRRDQEAPREKQEKCDTEDLTYSRHVWRAASRSVAALARLQSPDGKTPSLPPTLLFTRHTHPRITIIRCAIVDRCLHQSSGACPGSPGTPVVIWWGFSECLVHPRLPGTKYSIVCSI